MTSVDAFVDKKFPVGKLFCTQFLYSPEFGLTTLKGLSGKSGAKYDLAEHIADSIEKQSIDTNDVLLAFAKQPRKWLSFQLGVHKKVPMLKKADKLITEFGEEGWYGPIQEKDELRSWYVRTVRVPFYERLFAATDAETLLADKTTQAVKSVETHYIRWTIIAELNEGYVSLSWNGFRHNSLQGKDGETRPDYLAQFPYWNYIPKMFSEFSEDCQAEWSHPVLHEIVLQRLWDKYLSDAQYIWQHLRIRADNRGVALNAHSTGVVTSEELKMKGLQALSRQLASSALNVLDIADESKVDLVENSLLRTLIQEWGTKSYEFSLDKVSTDKEKRESLFRAHCYFANGPSSSLQDSFQHLHCFKKDYGGSSQALDFLLSESED